MRNIFSLAVSCGSIPAPSSMSAATVPDTFTLPMDGFNILLTTLRRVDLPAPFVPTNPQASPFLICRLMFLSAMNSWNMSCLVTRRMKYSFRLSTLRLFLLNLIVTSFSSMMVSPSATVVVCCAFDVNTLLTSCVSLL